MAKPSVLVVGRGAFGTSTAFHISHRGYTSVTVLDRFDAPSTDAAANDLNKVVRFDYPNPLYTKLGREATDVWTSPTSIFANVFRKTGWIMSGHEMTTGWLKKSYELAKAEKREGVRCLSAEDINRQWPAFTGDFPGWTNLWSPNAGWVCAI
jgi:sarcosine oxidase / L-pipecolate oxidase